MKKPELTDFVNWMWATNPSLIPLDEAIEQFKDYMRLKYSKRNISPMLISELVRSINKDTLFNLPAAISPVPNYRETIMERIDHHKTNLDICLKILTKADNLLDAEFYTNSIREINTRISELQTLLISIS